MNILKNILSSGALLLSAGCMMAGNIPQYTFSMGTNKYAELTDATNLNAEFEPQSGAATLIFADGQETYMAYKGPGFPIGFNFKFGGQEFTHFVVDTSGVVYLCDSEGLSFEGQAGDAFQDPYAGTTKKFYVGMTPVLKGLLGGDVSYKTEGTEGNRVLTVQYKNIIFNEPLMGGLRGEYNLQVRLYETGKVEMAFDEVVAAVSVAGFYVGLRGWDVNDSMLLTAGNIDKVPTISTRRAGDMTYTDSFIRWTESTSETADTKPVYVFEPCTDNTLGNEAPQNLTVKQRGSTLTVNVEKAPNSKATMILWSMDPFDEEDMPVNGVTYPAGAEISDAFVLYYGDDDEITATVSGIQSSESYYFRAIPVNGIPTYDFDHVANALYSSAQAAPSVVNAVVDGNTAKLSWEADYPVIVAATETRGAYVDGYAGSFGQPNPDVAVGDVILNDGKETGKVIYIGSDKECTYEMNPNKLTYFRVWTLNEGTVSALGTNAYAIPEVTIPYEPAIENYPLAQFVEGWSYMPGDTSTPFRPIVREGDRTNALRSVSVNEDDEATGTPGTIITPELPMDKALAVEFEFSLETPNPLSDVPGSTPTGNHPGEFGLRDGEGVDVPQEGNGLFVTAGVNGTENVYHTVLAYNGTMEGNGEAGLYKDGSSSYQKVVATVPAIEGGKGKIGILFRCKTSSIMYLRGIKITDAAGVDVLNADNDLAKNRVYAAQGRVIVSAAQAGNVPVYSIDGRIVANPVLAEGETAIIALPAGIYVAEGVKLIVK